MKFNHIFYILISLQAILNSCNKNTVVSSEYKYLDSSDILKQNFYYDFVFVGAKVGERVGIPIRITRNRIPKLPFEYEVSFDGIYPTNYNGYGEIVLNIDIEIPKELEIEKCFIIGEIVDTSINTIFVNTSTKKHENKGYYVTECIINMKNVTIEKIKVDKNYNTNKITDKYFIGPEYTNSRQLFGEYCSYSDENCGDFEKCCENLEIGAIDDIKSSKNLGKFKSVILNKKIDLSNKDGFIILNRFFNRKIGFWKTKNIGVIKEKWNSDIFGEYFRGAIIEVEWYSFDIFNDRVNISNDNLESSFYCIKNSPQGVEYTANYSKENYLVTIVKENSSDMYFKSK